MISIGMMNCENTYLYQRYYMLGANALESKNIVSALVEANGS